MKLIMQVSKLWRGVAGVLGLSLLSLVAEAQNVGGIGAMLKIDSTGESRMPMIIKLVPASPAAASLKENQFIIKVNDVSCKNKTIEDVVGLIRGEVGTHVKVLVADNKDGKKAKEYDLVRATIQTPAPPAPIATADAVTAFNTWCDNETKQLKRKGHAITQTFSSDCGSFFFNFNAEAELYHVKVFVLEDLANAAAKKGQLVSVKVYDSREEPNAVKLTGDAPPQDMNVGVISQLHGTIQFKKAGVGIVNTDVQAADAAMCKTLYIVVYK